MSTVALELRREKIKRDDRTASSELTLRAIHLLAFFAWITACEPQRIISRPSLAPNPDWRLEEYLPYVYGGVSRRDHLVGPDFVVAIEALNGGQLPQLVIRLVFLGTDKNPIEFTPSSVVVELNAWQPLQATGYECMAALLENPPLRRSAIPIHKTVISQKYRCIDLYFDTQRPSVDHVFKMRIGGVYVNARAITVPEVTFHKGIAHW